MHAKKQENKTCKKEKNPSGKLKTNVNVRKGRKR